MDQVHLQDVASAMYHNILALKLVGNYFPRERERERERERRKKQQLWTERREGRGRYQTVTDQFCTPNIIVTLSSDPLSITQSLIM